MIELGLLIATGAIAGLESPIIHGFKPKDLFKTSYGPNVPPPTVWAALIETARRAREIVLLFPDAVPTSFYRSQAAQDALYAQLTREGKNPSGKTVKVSRHGVGRAVDISGTKEAQSAVLYWAKASGQWSEIVDERSLRNHIHLGWGPKP